YAPYCESTCVSFETVAPSIDQLRERIERITVGYPWLIGEIDDQIAGYVYASQYRDRAAYRWAAEVAVYIATAHHRRGLGRALYDSLFSILRQQGYFRALAGISLPNAASVGLHEHLGFRPAGAFRGVGYKCNRWVDVGWWQLDLQVERRDPPDPRPFGELRDTLAVAEALRQSQCLIQSSDSRKNQQEAEQ
ncbi:MAG TPA: GNAT family N-acetyltransferase, partial [Lacipirellulaceae bacterium]|nr:GNAT family N-acetyltransferase [Lacipirellulaceae bacterium]